MQAKSSQQSVPSQTSSAARPGDHKAPSKAPTPLSQDALKQVGGGFGTPHKTW